GLPAWHLAGRRVERGASRALPHRPGGPAARDRRLPHAREDGAHPPGPPLPSRGAGRQQLVGSRAPRQEAAGPAHGLRHPLRVAAVVVV
ncbi:unnamed protein product, partial [Lampetra planeri]